MGRIKDFQQAKPATGKSMPVWRQMLRSLFCAAERLHRYRDARDVLLQHVIYEHEQRLSQQHCCGER